MQGEADGDRAEKDVQLIVVWVQKRRLLLLALPMEQVIDQEGLVLIDDTFL